MVIPLSVTPWQPLCGKQSAAAVIRQPYKPKTESRPEISRRLSPIMKTKTLLSYSYFLHHDPIFRLDADEVHA